MSSRTSSFLRDFSIWRVSPSHICHSVPAQEIVQVKSTSKLSLSSFSQSRTIPGQKFAMLVMKFALINVLSNFEVLPSNSSCEVVLSAETVLKAHNGVNIRLKSRTQLSKEKLRDIVIVLAACVSFQVKTVIKTL